MSSTSKELSTSVLQHFPEWTNDDRMNSLFAPIRKGAANDQDTTSKINFWSRFIDVYLKDKQICCFSIYELQTAFERKASKPRCLDVVIDAMLSSGEIVPEEIFMQLSEESWKTWVMNKFVKSPTFWLFSYVKGYVVNPSINIDQQFIYLQNIKILANFLLDHIPAEKENRTMTFDEIMTIFTENNKPLSKTTVKQIIVHLTRNKKATFYPPDINKSLILIKVSRLNSNDITEQEITFHSLKIKEEYLIHEIKELEEKKLKTLNDIKTNLSSNRRQVAKTLLKKKKEIERIIENRSNALVSIETLLMRILDATMNAEMIAGYGMASDILKKYTKEITEDSVIDAQEDLREKIETIKSLEDIVSESVVNTSVTDLELEEELNELLLKDEEQQIDTMLPDISKLNLKELSINSSPSYSNNEKVDVHLN